LIDNSRSFICVGSDPIWKKDVIALEKAIEIIKSNKPTIINELVQKAHQNAKDHGFWDVTPTFRDIIALIHSEASEALEEHRNHRKPTETYYSGKREVFDLEDKPIITITAYSKSPCKEVVDFGMEIDIKKPEGIPSEMADIVIRVMDYCGYAGIDLEKAIAEKMEYNRTRPFKHGGKTI
jgi:NTP pyrophosphatase (non-canonical NTP hydrolase)